jgi:hypothetical protein
MLFDNLCNLILSEQLAKGKTIEDIARLHNVDLDTLKKELKKGTNVEMEHTSSREQAEKIAMDHLVEDPKYYTKIKKMGL